MSGPDRILLIRPSALGDVCRTVPVLASLRAWQPDAQIDWLVRDAFVPAIASHPALTNAISFPRTQFASWWRRPSVCKSLLGWLSELRHTRYDLVIDCQGLARSGFFTCITGAKHRVGYANAAEFGWMGLNQRVRVPNDLHTVDRMLALTAAAGAPAQTDMQLYTSKHDRSQIPASLAGVRYALLAPTSAWPGKRWPADRFAAVAHALLAENLVDAIAVVGATHEQPQCEPLRDIASRDARVIDLTGRTDVGGLMAAVENASIVLANDSAPLHMAVGFGRPMVGLFGPTRIDRVGPYKHDADVLQRIAPHEQLDHKQEQLGLELLRRITVDEVVEAMRTKLCANKQTPQESTP